MLSFNFRISRGINIDNSTPYSYRREVSYYKSSGSQFSVLTWTSAGHCLPLHSFTPVLQVLNNIWRPDADTHLHTCHCYAANTGLHHLALLCNEIRGLRPGTCPHDIM